MGRLWPVVQIPKSVLDVLVYVCAGSSISNVNPSPGNGFLRRLPATGGYPPGISRVLEHIARKFQRLPYIFGSRCKWVQVALVDMAVVCEQNYSWLFQTVHRQRRCRAPWLTADRWHAALVVEVLTVQCSPCLMYGVVDVDVDIVHKIVILVPVSAPFALKTRYVSKKYVKIIFHKLPNHPFYPRCLGLYSRGRRSRSV